MLGKRTSNGQANSEARRMSVDSMCLLFGWLVMMMVMMKGEIR